MEKKTWLEKAQAVFSIGGSLAAIFGAMAIAVVVIPAQRAVVPVAAVAPADDGADPPAVRADTPAFATGWVDDKVEVAAAQGLLPVQGFAGTPAGQSLDPLPDHVYLWDFHRKFDARGPPTKNQGSVGSCVSFGTATAIERTLAVEVAVGGMPGKEWRRLVEEVIYGGSRVDVGQGRIRGDGSTGGWAAVYVTGNNGKGGGVLDRGVHGSYDLTAYSTTRCRQWGSQGPPRDLKAEINGWVVGDAAPVRTTDEAQKALATGCGIAVCSNQGFSMTRDSRGVCRPQGTWGHCMCIDGFHVEGGNLFFHIENSWGETAFSGPVGWGNPGPGGFWSEARVVRSMLAMNDSYAYSAVKGFPSRRVNWLVNAPRPEHADRFALAP